MNVHVACWQAALTFIKRPRKYPYLRCLSKKEVIENLSGVLYFLSADKKSYVFDKFYEKGTFQGVFRRDF